MDKKGPFGSYKLQSFYFHQHNIGRDIHRSCILLDNQSTVDVFWNTELLFDIKTSDQNMNIYWNSGVSTKNLIGHLPGYGDVWYYPKGIDNILSLSKVKKNKYRITYDIHDWDVIHRNKYTIHKDDGMIHQFVESDDSLYYMDTTNNQHTDMMITTTK